MQDEMRRSRALDAWNYQAPFARFHIDWGEAESAPAFEQMQAFGIALQDLGLAAPVLELLAHREVLVQVSSERLELAKVPAWVVMIAGRKRGEAGCLQAIAQDGGVVVQALVHARTGEVLLGTAVPVRLG